MKTREMHHIVLTTSKRTKKLHIDNEQHFIDWLTENNKFFDVYKDTITVLCETTEERKEIRKELSKLSSS